ncbi:MAG: substrate-binding domain-containing protein [Defluviitaleaceae bacterium]|nr:substrate-binding domain-containing protein [Defluviitaleaceae bacterium]
MTIKEIAGKANVSLATVSMIVNNKPGVSAQTKEKVLKIMEESGYSIPLVKSIRKKGNIQLMIYRSHSKVVGDTPFFQELIEGIESKSQNNGYGFVIKYAYADSLNFLDFQREIINQNIDGILLLATEMDEATLRRFLEMKIPLVVVDAYFLGVPAEYVVINNVLGGYLATRRLLEAGHTEVGYLKSSYMIQNFNERFDGFTKALAEFKMTPDDNYILHLGPSAESSYENTLAYLEKGVKLPTAFFADNDLIAFGAMSAFKEKSIRIPEDVSIVGFDDMPLCAFSEPSLTTVRVNKQIFGEFAVQRLLEQIKDGRNNYFTSSLDVSLVQRNSVKTIGER